MNREMYQVWQMLEIGLFLLCGLVKSDFFEPRTSLFGKAIQQNTGFGVLVFFDGFLLPRTSYGGHISTINGQLFKIG